LSKELLAPIMAGTASKPVEWVRNLGIVSAGSVSLAICSHIALPLYFTPVPLTLQTFAVFLLGLLLSPRLAAGTVFAYLAEGALGLPVFAPLPAMPGLVHLVGPTGGYLLALPLAAEVTSVLWQRIGRGVTGAWISAAVSSLIIFACGGLWLGIMTHASIRMVLASAVIPFIPGDLLKISAAALIAGGVQRLRRN
jgi:biotin transport system substrate-specific component